MTAKELLSNDKADLEVKNALDFQVSAKQQQVFIEYLCSSAVDLLEQLSVKKVYIPCYFQSIEIRFYFVEIYGLFTTDYVDIVKSIHL